MSDTERDMITARCESAGLTVQGWDEEAEDGLTAKLGRYECGTADYEDEGLFTGDTGELTANVVGAEQYGNQRVAFWFIPDGMDGGTDVSDDLFAMEAVS